MRERYALLLLLLTFLAALKWEFNPGLGRNSLDGDYYYQVARHVAEGDGLKTSVSLYHQGFKELPHDTNIYPVWPLTLGLIGRHTNLSVAAVLLPELLYLIDLLLLYLLANRLFERISGRPDRLLLRKGKVLDGGHAAVLLLGLNPVFFNFTSLPYTEALAFTFLLGSLWALDRAAGDPGSTWPILAGGLATLGFMTRSQLLGVVVAVIVALGLAAVKSALFTRKAVLAAAVSGLALAPWVRHLMGFVQPFNPRAMLTIGVYRETPEIEPFQWTVAYASFWERVADWGAGLVTALNPLSRFSYLESFGLAVWLVPLALLALAVRPREVLAAVKGIVRPSRVAVTATVIAAFLMLAPLHVLHSRYLGTWRFGHRHGLPLILLLVLALAYVLAKRGRWMRGLALALVAASVVTGAFGTARLLNTRYASGLLGPEPELVAWLDAQGGKPTVLTTNVHTLAVYSRAGFHWMECRESAEKAERMLELLPIDYVLIYDGEDMCPFSDVTRDLARVRTFGSGRQRIEVYGTSG